MRKLISFVLSFVFMIIMNNTLANSVNPLQFLKLNSDSNLLLYKQIKNKLERNVWSVIDVNQKVNEPLFKPFNDISLMEKDRSGNDTVNGFTTLKNESIQWNLWNIIMLNIMYGNLTIYSPVNQDWIADIDNGFLNYPFIAEKFGDNKKGTFFTDEKFRYNLIFYGLLGMFYNNHPEPMMSILYPGEDSISIEGTVVYYPNDYFWYEDKDIIGYKIKEKWVYNKKGKVINKIISAIAPIVYQRNNIGEVIGKKELFWIDYKELKPILKDYKLLIAYKKRDALISLYKFINNRMFYADMIKAEERFKVSEK